MRFLDRANHSGICARIGALAHSLAIVVLALVCSPVLAQQPLQPVQASAGVATPNMYVLHTKDWPTGNAASLPQPYVTRTNAGERWYNIELARGTYCTSATQTPDTADCESQSSGYTYTHLGNLFTVETTTGWIPAAQQNGGATHPAALMYTFSGVPSWALPPNSTDTAHAAPPSDVPNSSEPCSGVLSGYTSQKGDCMFKEYVTYVMRALCHVTQAPSTPKINGCDIHYFEGWNEFNTNGSWTGSYQQLAQMMADADEIVHQYCGDCYFMAGSVSAGGDGYNPQGGSSVYVNALGQLLDYWHAYDSSRSPDILSIHAYPSHQNVFPIPMPETNIPDVVANATTPSGMFPASDDTDAHKCTAGNAYTTNTLVYPEPTPDRAYACRDSLVNLVPEIKLLIAHESSWLPSTTPIWNTESSWGDNRGLNFGTLTNAVDTASDTSLTDTEMQAYIARSSILLASSGIAVNLWYEMDNPSFGTLVTYSGTSTTVANLTPSAQTFNRVNSWLSGVTFTSNSGCSGSSGIWSCSITKADGTRAMVVWYAPTNQAATFTMPSGLSYVHDMDGNTSSKPAGQTFRLFNRPVLLDTSSAEE